MPRSPRNTRTSDVCGTILPSILTPCRRCCSPDSIRLPAAYSNEVSAQAQVQAHLGICENPIVDAYLFSRSQELERQGFRVQLRVLLPGGLRVPISRTYRSTAREQFFSRLQI